MINETEKSEKKIINTGSKLCKKRAKIIKYPRNETFPNLKR